MNWVKGLLRLLSLLWLLWIGCEKAYAIAPVPASTQPGVIGKVIDSSLPQTTQPSTTAAPVSAPPEAKVPYNAAAAKIRFKLTKIILEGNTVYSVKELETLYKAKINTEMSVLDFQQIVQSITNYYRNNGYILSRAIIPPQHVKNGVVRVQVIEGFVNQVKIEGDARNSVAILKKYAAHISASKPLQMKILDRYLRLANEVPGITVKGVLKPAEKTQAAAVLVLVVEEKRLGGYLSYDNYGTRYLGPHEYTLNTTLTSGYLSGDALSLTFLDTTRPRQLRFMDLTYQFPLGASGLQFVFDTNKSLTDAGYVLTNANVIGVARNFSALLRYPWIRTADRNLTIDGGLYYYNGILTSLGFLLYEDNIRAIRLGGTYLFSDKYRGSNSFDLHLDKGLPIYGATTNAQSFTTSRFGATGVYTRLMMQFSRDQYLYDKFSMFFQANAQYAFNPLLSYAQFAYGGSVLGRGYDPAEILGDDGLGASVELRMNINPGLRLFQAAQLYGFYDGGIVGNRKDIIDSFLEVSAMSTGAGLRFNFNKYINGNFMITQPLTKKVAALEIIGDGKCPRVFFSVTASV